MTTILHPDGTVQIKERRPSLEEMQAMVGGWIERIPSFDFYKGEPCEAYANEEGKIRSLAYNAAATTLWRAHPGHTGVDFLVGPVTILTGAERWDSGA